MAKLEWDKSGERFYETGTRKGVLYLLNTEGAYAKGVAWNGITAVTESPEGADVSDFYADDIKYASMRAAENFTGTIEAYTYPEEFGECDGSAALAAGVHIGQQTRKTFGFSYVSQVSNDIGAEEYKLHLIYGLTASPSEKGYESINDSPDAITFSWEVSSTPVNVTNHKATSTVTIDSRTADKAKLTALETILYGSETVEPRMPLPDEIATLFAAD